MSDKLVTFKGFDADFKCRGYQYKVGETFRHEGKVICCPSTEAVKQGAGGLHSCEYPLDVFNYFPPSGGNLYAVVEASGAISRNGDGDSKIASAELHIKAQIQIPELVAAAVDWIKSKLDFSLTPHLMTGNYSASTNTGDKSASTNTGDKSASTNTGNSSASTNTGNYSASTNTGNYSASTNTGNYSASTNTGYSSASTNTGNYSASTNTGDKSASTNTGNYSASTNTGYSSASTNTGDKSASTNTGDKSASTVEGKESVAIATGYAGKAKAAKGSAIVLCSRDMDGKLLAINSAIVGKKGVKPDTFYTLNEKGKFVEVKD